MFPLSSTLTLPADILLVDSTANLLLLCFFNTIVFVWVSTLYPSGVVTCVNCILIFLSVGILVSIFPFASVFSISVTAVVVSPAILTLYLTSCILLPSIALIEFIDTVFIPVISLDSEPISTYAICLYVEPSSFSS